MYEIVCRFEHYFFIRQQRKAIYHNYLKMSTSRSNGFQNILEFKINFKII